MFLDIRGFTSFSERRDPGDVVSYLNTLFDFMVETVNRHQGIINKFLGDGFMAVFGAPLPDAEASRHAVDAAREILSQLESLNAAGRIPPTRIGIGLHSGKAVTGTVGSAQRKEYTIIGDVVNVASRIEQLNKQFDAQLLISEEVWNAVGEGHEIPVRLGPVHVKGHEADVQVLRLA
jgi:adenylate cyclase